MYAGGCGHTTEEYGKFMAVVRMRKQWCQAISQKRPLDSWKGESVALFPTLDGCASCIYLLQPVCRLPPATSVSYLSREMLQEESLALPTMLLAFLRLDNAFVCIQSLHLRIPPRVLHFSAIHYFVGECTALWASQQHAKLPAVVRRTAAYIAMHECVEGSAIHLRVCMTRRTCT